MNKLKSAALDYASRGWPVFPVRSDKTPFVENGVLEATTNKKQIEKWWNEFPHANIAMDVGGAGMVVLDLDQGTDKKTKEYFSIDQVYDFLEEALGHIPETGLIQRTPRGGEHLFFTKSHDEVIPASSSKIAKRVDVRSFHSYVLLAPSRTPDGQYTWESEGKPAYRSDEVVRLAGEKKEQSHEHDTWLIDPDIEENVATAIQYLKRDAQIAIEGRNGDEMAYKTAAMMKSYGISKETALDLIWQYWNPRCEPPWSPDEIDHLETKIENAYKYNTSPPGNMTDAYRAAKTSKLFQPVSRDTDTGGKATEAGRFRFVDERGVDEIKPPEWLIKDAIPQRAYAMLIGPRGTYKTFIALDMALSIATGGKNFFADDDWLGPWPNIVTKGPVLFAAGEGRASFKQRVNAWKDYHIEGDYTDNFYLVDPVPYPHEDDLDAFISGAKSLSDTFELVVLDTVGRSMRGMNENSQQDASLFNGMVEHIQRELNTAVLAIHHTGHGAADRARGSSVFGADVDVEFVTDKYKDNIVRLKNTKQKDAPEWEDAKLIHVIPHQNSLVAVEPTKQIRQPIEAEQQDEATEPKKNKKGRVKSIDLNIVRTAAYKAMKAYPGKEWSNRSLSQAIAADDSIQIGASTIRQYYMDELTTDKKHPVAACYDIGKMVWKFTAPNKSD